ncbi:MAG TPA: hypothetical protein VN918_02925 [Myxococcaceae bacterium]|nr:hypothetical protein [Myxococcaceae bacterium]
MKKPGRIIALALSLSVTAAHASAYDFRLYRLGNPLPGGMNYDPSANANFRTFARELGAALTSITLMPPSTLGYDGFAIGTELSILNLKTSQFLFPTESGVSGPLLVPSLHLRKGLPFSFELGARAGWIQKSGMAVATIELKWAINEGFANWPDLGIRGHFTRLFNARDFDLYTGGVDVGIGKRFAIAGTMTITPYAGWNPVWVAAFSKTVDFNPGRSYEDSVSTPTSQLRDTAVYDDVRAGSNMHHRFYAGLQFVLGVFQAGAEASYSTLGQIRDEGTGTDRSLPSLLAFNATIGLGF